MTVEVDNMKLIAVPAVLLAAVALAACGGGSSSSTENPPASTSVASTPTSTASKPERFRQSLVSDRGFTEAQAACIAKGVVAKIGRAQFDKLYGSGHVPQNVQTIIFKIAGKCAPRGPGQ
jgi:ABC-type phosphate/phosphonate transport system substrate-binding protein